MMLTNGDSKISGARIISILEPRNLLQYFALESAFLDDPEMLILHGPLILAHPLS